MKTTLEKLGTMVNNGFNSLQGQINALAFDVRSLKEGQEAIYGRLTVLELGQETIILRLDQHAYKMDADNLNRRFTKLEEKFIK
jgi:hypothetical protein